MGVDELYEEVEDNIQKCTGMQMDVQAWMDADSLMHDHIEHRVGELFISHLASCKV